MVVARRGADNLIGLTRREQERTIMQRFIILRLLQGLLAVFAISLIVFSLSRVAGDPLAAILDDESGKEQIELLRAQWGLDEPLHVQYFTYMRRLLTGRPGHVLQVGPTGGGTDSGATAGDLATIRLCVACHRSHRLPGGRNFGGEKRPPGLTPAAKCSPY